MTRDEDPLITPAQRAYLRAFDAWLHDEWARGVDQGPARVLKDACLSEVRSEGRTGERASVKVGRARRRPCKGCGKPFRPPKGPGRPRKFCTECKPRRQREPCMAQRALPIATACEGVWRAMVTLDGRESMWPTGQCLGTTALLLPILRAAGFQPRIHVGPCTPPGREQPINHAWLRFPDGSVLDPTWGQFAERGGPTGVFRESPHHPPSPLSVHAEQMAVAQARVVGTQYYGHISTGQKIAEWVPRDPC